MPSRSFSVSPALYHAHMAYSVLRVANDRLELRHCNAVVERLLLLPARSRLRTRQGFAEWAVETLTRVSGSETRHIKLRDDDRLWDETFPHFSAPRANTKSKRAVLGTRRYGPEPSHVVRPHIKREVRWYRDRAGRVRWRVVIHCKCGAELRLTDERALRTLQQGKRSLVLS